MVTQILIKETIQGAEANLTSDKYAALTDIFNTEVKAAPLLKIARTCQALAKCLARGDFQWRRLAGARLQLCSRVCRASRSRGRSGRCGGQPGSLS